MSEPLYVGIDVAKDTFCVATTAEQNCATLPNMPQGHRQLCQRFKNHPIAYIVLEAAGGYERASVAESLAAQLPVVVVNPRQVRDFSRGMGQWAKTDPIDARVLATFAQLVNPPSKSHATPQTEALAEMVRRRRQLRDLHAQETNCLAIVRHPKVKKSIPKMVCTLENQLAQNDDLIRHYIEADEQFKHKDRILQSVPGVGTQTSAALIAALPELGQLNRQQIAALAGVAPWDRSSGKWYGHAHLFGGQKEVRCALYPAAFTTC